MYTHGAHSPSSAGKQSFERASVSSVNNVATSFHSKDTVSPRRKSHADGSWGKKGKVNGKKILDQELIHVEHFYARSKKRVDDVWNL